MKSDVRITVFVTPEEHAKIKKAAGLVPLSAWMAHLALCACDAEYSGWEPQWIKSNKGRNHLQPFKKAKRT